MSGNLVTTISGQDCGHMYMILEEDEGALEEGGTKDFTITSRADGMHHFPYKVLFPRIGGEGFIEVSWASDCSKEEIPTDPLDRAVIQRLVAEVGIARGHDVAFITTVHFRARWVKTTSAGATRFLMYAEHIEAEFRKENTADSTVERKPDEPAHETAVVYFGPEGEEDREKIRLWRNGDRDPVVWSRVDAGIGEMIGEMRLD